VEVILLEKIQNLGGLGDRVNVKPGHARNYLVPHGKALYATEDNLAVFESRRADLEAQAAAEVETAQGRARSLEAIELTLARKVNAGRLFGSVGAPDVVEALLEAGAEVKRSEVRMPEGVPIRQTGQYEVRVRVHPDAEAVVKLAVVSEDAGEDEELERFELPRGEDEEPRQSPREAPEASEVTEASGSGEVA